jgi:predicted Zn-dependent peptidase
MLIALLLLAQTAVLIQDTPRLKSELSNGAVVLAERVPESKTMAVQLLASCRGVAESRESHGRRHLLEHLIAKGRSGDLDLRLEARGVFLRAETTRDFLRVSITGPAGELDLALQAISEVLLPTQWTKEQVAKEAGIVAQELALLPDATLFSNAMWRAAYGDAGLDPLGDKDVVATTTPDQLATLWRDQFSAPNLLLAVSGPLSVDEQTRRAKTVLVGLSKAAPKPLPSRPAGKPGRTEVDDAFGEARGALTPGFLDQKTAAIVAAGFAIAGFQQGGYLTYTPTSQFGLVLVGQTDDNYGLGMKIDELTDAEKAAYFEPARNMARRWYLSLLQTPVQAGRLRGGLQLMSPGARPETFLSNLESMTPADFLRGFEAFSKDRAVIGVGVAR